MEVQAVVALVVGTIVVLAIPAVVLSPAVDGFYKNLRTRLQRR
jgi:hypothetical protein